VIWNHYSTPYLTVKMMYKCNIRITLYMEYPLARHKDIIN